VKWLFKKKRPTEAGRQTKDAIFSAVKVNTKLNIGQANVK
jgi:hypothetical protein